MPTRFGFLSTYPPTQCGLATFTASLSAELMGPDRGSGLVVRAVDTPQPRAAREVVGELVAGNPVSAERTAGALNRTDVAIVQHEYGVFGGPDGDEVLGVLRALTVPTIVVLHTILEQPTGHQRAVLESVVSLADAVVAMTDTARDRLAAGYAVDMAKVSVIPHGAPAARVSFAPSFRTTQQTVLTWGLIGPGKGIEWGIEAMARLSDLNPPPRYLVAGKTHPKVLEHAGETYRNMLLGKVKDLNLSASVSFDSHYRHNAALAELVSSADIVLLPYDSTDQITSGVLIEAVAALKPVVATRFPHAVDLLSDGAGILVPHRDPDAIANALRTLLTDRALAAGMTRVAARSAPDLLWPAVAQRYRRLADDLIRARVAA